MGGRGASSGAAPRGRGIGGQGTGAGQGNTATQTNKTNTTGSNGFAGTVDGKDISASWNKHLGWDSDTPEAIQDAMDDQGFRGMPRLVKDKAEYDQAVKDAWDGQGLEIIRGVGARDKETLDLYEDSMKRGEWYVACNGGAAYGHGQYGAYKKGGKVTKNEIDEAKKYTRPRTNAATKVYRMTLDPSAKIVNYYDVKNEMDAYNAKKSYTNQISDVGVFATLKGYDAIVVDGGRKYSVVLNRTKLVIFD